jgi:hypothetical protein
MHGSRSKIPSTCVYEVKFLALLGTPYIYDISRLRVNDIRLNLNIDIHAENIKCRPNKVKSIPLQALSCLESFRRLRLPDF